MFIKRVMPNKNNKEKNNKEKNNKKKVTEGIIPNIKDIKIVEK